MLHETVVGVAGTKLALFCYQHAEDGMVNVARKECAYLSCTSRV